MTKKCIEIRGAHEHNLQGFDLDLPLHLLIGVCGISGSGKTSLAFDTLFKEGQRRFLESLSLHTRQFLASEQRPRVESIRNLPAAIAVDQRSVRRHSRSTVGTLSGLFFPLRMLYARGASRPCDSCHKKIRADLEQCPHCASKNRKLTASHFSFNSDKGACPNCKGLGVEDRVDPDLLIADPSLSIAQGALVPTTKSGYIVYSQVTVDVLKDIAKAHGFDLDTPWQDLKEEDHQVIFYGSNKLKVPFGKHSLESRMRWSGISARPRQEGYYRGIIPTIEDILKRDRNENALRFARSFPCSQCKGQRLDRTSLAAHLYFKKEDDLLARNIADVANLSATEMARELSSIVFDSSELKEALKLFIQMMQERLLLMNKLGLGHLTLFRSANSLSTGEAKRLRLLAQLIGGLSGLFYVFDEPMSGLHQSEYQAIVDAFDSIIDRDNTIMMVEHHPDVLALSDHIVDIGPFAGNEGGKLLASSRKSNYLSAAKENAKTPTQRLFVEEKEWDYKKQKEILNWIALKGINKRCFNRVDVRFALNRLNIICGKSGTGKTTLLLDILGENLQRLVSHGRHDREICERIEGFNPILRVVKIDANPIGRTPRSNPATYTKVFDDIRNLYAALPAAKEKGLTRSSFSFNTKGGRCEVCQGAGYRQIGMHFMTDVEFLCDSCQGKRFVDEVLSIRYKNLTIADVLDLKIGEAADVFSDQKKIATRLNALIKVGLSYLNLGQRATTLSGGEAQRIKLAAELSKPTKKHTLFLLDEPSTGLHGYDLERLLSLFNDLITSGHSIVIADHDLLLLKNADHLIQLEKNESTQESKISYEGVYSQDAFEGEKVILKRKEEKKDSSRDISLSKVSTHNLKAIDLKIPLHQITVITGKSGSGKSSLAFDTIAAEAKRRYAENLSSVARRYLGKLARPIFEEIKNLRPTIAIDQNLSRDHDRSTVGTMTEINEFLRLIFSRQSGGRFTMREFSFNHQSGACKACQGRGRAWRFDEKKFISSPCLSLIDGATKGTSRGRYYGESDGRFIAILKTIFNTLDFDITQTWKELDSKAKDIVCYGTGEKQWDVEWNYKRGQRKGVHQFQTKWLGFSSIIEEDFHLATTSRKQDQLKALLSEVDCELCEGSRLNQKVRQIKVADSSIDQLQNLSVRDLIHFIATDGGGLLSDKEKMLFRDPLNRIFERLKNIEQVGLSHLSLSRPLSTLSTGELRRLQIASAIESSLSDIIYVIDEPSLGLHIQDLEALNGIFDDLIVKGNTLIIVDHHPILISHADYRIELGPGSGDFGGEVLYAAKAETDHNKNYGIKRIDDNHQLVPSCKIKKAFAHNLKDVDISVAISALNVICGVSGSGKSTLLFDVIAKSIENQRAEGCCGLEGFDQFDSIVKVDATSIGRTPKSTIATYTGYWDALKSFYGKSDQAKAKGLGVKDFSTSNSGSQCDDCKGVGALKIELDIFEDYWSECPTCLGKRLQPKPLSVRYKGLSIADALSLRAEDVARYFQDDKIAAISKALCDCGLGYMRMDRWSTTLSGGEAQRVKIAKALLGKKKGQSLYLLDEPTRGLHPEDSQILSKLFMSMVECGETLLMIEHDLSLISAANWIVELGGKEGGELLFSGKPSDLSKKTPIGFYLSKQ